MYEQLARDAASALNAQTNTQQLWLAPSLAEQKEIKPNFFASSKARYEASKQAAASIQMKWKKGLKSPKSERAKMR